MSAAPFQIKICGITRAPDIVDAVTAGADAVGLNFYPKSKRYIRPQSQRDLASVVTSTDKLSFVLNRPVHVVGVFVNETPADINRIAAELSLSGIQLHGDEPPEFLAQVPELPLVRVRHLDARGLAAIAEDLAACRAAGRLPDAVLVDAMAPGQYGGTGEVVAWDALADYREWLGDVPLVLAGGLTAENVAQAIRIVRPAGVDVASGVEKSPGIKDQNKVRRFVEAAKTAFDSLR